MVTKYAMSDKVGHISLLQPKHIGAQPRSQGLRYDCSYNEVDRSPKRWLEVNKKHLKCDFNYIAEINGGR